MGGSHSHCLSWRKIEGGRTQIRRLKKGSGFTVSLCSLYDQICRKWFQRLKTHRWWTPCFGLSLLFRFVTSDTLVGNPVFWLVALVQGCYVRHVGGEFCVLIGCSCSGVWRQTRRYWILCFDWSLLFRGVTSDMCVVNPVFWLVALVQGCDVRHVGGGPCDPGDPVWHLLSGKMTA
jgi:hypothetical protein